jgi:hypothetical protein
MSAAIFKVILPFILNYQCWSQAYSTFAFGSKNTNLIQQSALKG